MIQYVAHRVNTIEELKSLNKRYGVEVDLRDFGNRLLLRHDPFATGKEQDFEEYLNAYSHGLMILNIKSERIEHRVLELIKKYDIKEYFFLDSSFPMIKLLSGEGESNVAVRFSEFECIDTVISMQGKVKWVWVDCFTKLPINNKNYSALKAAGFKLCLVSPELQGHCEDIENYAAHLKQEGVIFDAICAKSFNIVRWQCLLHAKKDATCFV